jgi:phospholipase/lecithinase/hemolysin
MNAFRLFTGLVVASIFSIFPTPAALAQITSVYAFGDGVCTTTDNNSSTPELYFGNRYCNGKVFIEDLADWQGLNYVASRNNSYFGQDSAELKINIDAFNPPNDVETALFVVWAANADFVEFYQTNFPPYSNSDKPAWTAFIEDSVTRHKQALNKLYNKGVRILVMPNAVDISATPFYQLPTADSNFLRDRAIQFNTLFQSEMLALAATKPGLTLYLPDTFQFFEDVLDDPAAYGLINPQVNGFSIDAITHLGNPSLTGPGANYVFWDYIHPTAKFQTKLSNFIENLIGDAPAVTTHPVSKTINSGNTTNLTVTFSGNSTSIQWYRGAKGVTTNPVSGATSATFTTPALTTNTSYWARITNVLGSDDSNAATITIRIPPTITTQPVSVTIASGSTTTLSTAASGTSPNFQWYVGNSGNISNPVSGATGSSFTTPALISNTTYWVRASNAAGTADSNAATVTAATPFALWQNNQFTTQELANPLISGPTADPDGDGLDNDQEYLFGLPPKAGNPSPSPAVALSGNQITLSFTAKIATGPGYTGLTRRYTLESSSAPGAMAWTAIPGFSNIAGNNQTVTYSTTASGPPKFFRLGVRVGP